MFRLVSFDHLDDLRQILKFSAGLRAINNNFSLVLFPFVEQLMDALFIVCESTFNSFDVFMFHLSHA